VIGDPAQQEATGIVTGILEQAVAELGIAAEIRYGIHQVLEQSGVLADAPAELQLAAEAQTMGVIWTQVQQIRQSPVIAVQSESLKAAADQVDAGPMDWYIMAFAVMFAFFLLPTMGESILREKEQGSLRRLLAAPLPRGAIIAGLILAYTLLVFLQVLFLFGVGKLVFDINLGPSPLGLFLITLATALAAASLGLLVGAVARNSEKANSLGMILGFGLSVVGGFPLPWFRIGGPMATIANIVPHAHSLQAYSGIMVDGYTLAQVSPHILALFGFAIVFFAVALWRFKFE
jgi:ABC-2 type transport system permease protein